MSDFRDVIDTVEDAVIVTDPPFNVGYHYGEYKDRMDEQEYYDMLVSLVNRFPCVFIHYPEALYRVAIESHKTPNRVISWVYNSNTQRQHRDIAYFGIEPNFMGALQEYKNPTDKRIQERIENGMLGGKMYDWWNVNQVKNVNKQKTAHPCQMPLEVMKNIIATLPEGTTVFEPFMGSGTTGVACKALGYDFIGCEIDKTYFEEAKNRIDNYDVYGDVCVRTENKQITLNELI